jgi:predicted RNA-binding Zn ribbon-like protein
MDRRIPEGEVPGEVRLVNEFLNTLDLETFGEHAGKLEDEREGLRSPEKLKAWLVGRGLLGEDEPVDEADRELAVRVRDALRSAAAANSRIADQSSDVADLGLGDLSLVVRLGEASKPELASAESGVRGALGRILADAAVASHKGTWARLKICNAEDCRWAYYDHSKSRTGRWCAMETCGNRHKTRRYRKRRKGVDADA